MWCLGIQHVGSCYVRAPDSELHIAALPYSMLPGVATAHGWPASWGQFKKVQTGLTCALEHQVDNLPRLKALATS
jgi:hypothetical protein